MKARDLPGFLPEKKDTRRIHDIYGGWSYEKGEVVGFNACLDELAEKEIIGEICGCVHTQGKQFYYRKEIDCKKCENGVIIKVKEG